MSRTGKGMRIGMLAALVAILALVVAACGGGGSSSSSSGGGGGGGAGEEINVAIVGNPQMEDIAKLTPELFTKKTGIKVNYTVLEEGKLRETTTRDVLAGGDEYDVAMIGLYEAPQFGQDGTLVNLTPLAEEDPEYEYEDLIPTIKEGLSVNGDLYAAPFYGESSFLMYRKDVLAKDGITMPPHPTWQQVAQIAKEVNTPQMAGICLRGKPGWGDLGASLTTVLNTFGATWWAANPDGSVGEAEIDQPQFKEALEFYVNLIHEAGEKDAAADSFNECLQQYQDSKVAMWYDATVGASSLEASNSPVKGKTGYAAAPVDKTESSNWLWSWALSIPKSTSKQEAAWKYVSWATGPQYIKEAGEKVEGGWAAIPPGTRYSTYRIPQYKKAAAAFAQPTLKAIEDAPLKDPGTTPRPGLPAVQFVGIPQFENIGNQCTEQFSAVIAERTDINSALEACQSVAEGVSESE